MKQPVILVVDDESTQRKLIQHVLEAKLGFRTIVKENGQQALDYLLSRQKPQPELVLLDLSMPVMDGMELIARVRPSFPNLPLIVLTIYGDVERAVAAIKAGATDFLPKPVAHERLRTSILNALTLSELAEEVQRLRRNQQGTLSFADIIGESDALKQCKKQAQRAAESGIPVLLEGESGVGKELFARAIHGGSDRAGAPFVAVNCGAIPENLAESILFGHEKGAFTGATYRHLGKLREAQGGTLFLDEISELPQTIQVKLLRAIQQKEVEPIGAGKAVTVDIRIISGSNKPLQQQVEDGSFREDLFYRLNVFPLQVPPLRERSEDIDALTHHFLRRYSALEGKRIRTATPEALRLLREYHWPGNIRQLENIIFRAVVLAEGDQLEAADLLSLLPASYLEQVAGDVARRASLHSRHLTLLDEKGNLRRFRDIEHDALFFALKKHGGRISEVARRLGIGRSTLYRKISDYGIEVA
jgi:DNA-binding NtrC family response regulator